MRTFFTYQDLHVKPDRNFYVSAGDINPKTGKAYAINPSNNTWDDNYFAQNFGGNQTTPSSGMGGSTDYANQALQFTRQANAPVVQTLKTQKTDLSTRYKDILESIKGEQTNAEQRQTVVTSNELGKRGITGSSGLAQQTISDALLPIAREFAGLRTNASLSETKDLNDLAYKIASLESGNPESALSTGVSLYNTDRTLAENKATREAEANKLQTSVIEVGGRKKLINTQTGEVIQDLGISSSGSSSGIDLSSIIKLLTTDNKTTTEKPASTPKSFILGGYATGGNYG